VIYGFAPEEVAPSLEKLTEVLHLDDQELVEKRRHTALHENEPYDFEHRIVRSDGEVRIVHRQAEVIFDEEGEPLRMVGTVHDVTEQKEAEEALERLNHQNELILNSAGEGIYGLDLQGKTTFVNQAATRLTGWDAEELIGRHQHDVIHHTNPDGTPYPSEECPIYATLKDGAVHRIIGEVFWRKDGTSFPVEYVSTPIRERGEIVGAVVLFEDVTERKRAEEKLRESEERFQSLVRNATDLITVLDEDGTILYESPTVERILGYLPEERIRKNAFDFLHPDDADKSKATFTEALDNPGHVQPPVEFRLRHKDGSWRHMETTRTNLLNDPAVKGVVANSRDITERKQTEEALKESEERYRAVVEQSVEAIWLFDPTSKQVLESNTAFQEMFGYAAEELKEMTNYDFVTHSRQNIDFAIQRIVQERKGFFGERKYRRKDGTVLDVEVSGSVIPYDGKEVVCAVARDLTERKKAEEALKESEERFRTAFEDAPIGVALVGLDRSHLRVNRAYCQMLGYSQEELLAKPHPEIIHPDDREKSADRIQGILEEGAKPYAIERRYIHADGHAVWSLSNITLIRDSEGEPSHFVCLHEDITERKRMEEQLRHEAFCDSLTGLPNRALFLNRLEHALSKTSREGGTVAVLFMDLDDFKAVNDSLGHDVGNDVLVQVAARLETFVRPGDTVGRIFGDEFAVLLEAPAGMEEARRISERIQEGLDAPFDVNGQEVFVSSSIGIARGETPEDQPREVLRQADLAMYAAKSRGKTQAEIYSPSMNTRAVERLGLERDLRRAIEREEFEAHYQPVIDLCTGEISGFEALARWRHPERGVVPAADFVVLAEETGLIRPIGQRVVEEACRQAKEWCECYPDRTLLMSVNLSASQFSRQPDLIPKTLNNIGLDPEGLQVEITERVVMDDAEFSLGKLQMLKNLGVSFAIDDYGMGYSCLYYLKRMPLDYLKIDRAFITGLGEGDQGDEAIVSGTIGLAHALGLKVVAEGVETEGQLAKLKELGCDLAQGYYFAKPLLSEAVETLLLKGIAFRSPPRDHVPEGHP
jgi:diguanylate cyclase (GGDEF)-like protein/PAS domain S-box-containing protein